MSSRKRQLIADITGRLKRLCPHMTDDEFARMVNDIATMTMNYEGNATPTREERQRSADAERHRKSG